MQRWIIVNIIDTILIFSDTYSVRRYHLCRQIRNSYLSWYRFRTNLKIFTLKYIILKELLECQMCVSSCDRDVQIDWTPSKRTHKINIPKKRKGCNKSETTNAKLLTRRIQIYCIFFVWSIFGLSLFKHVKTGPKQKLTRQKRILLVKPITEVSGPSEVLGLFGDCFFRFY